LHQLEQLTVSLKVEIPEFAHLAFPIDGVVVNLLFQLAYGERVLRWSHDWGRDWRDNFAGFSSFSILNFPLCFESYL